MTNNITSDIKSVNLSSLWPQTSHCYPLYIPDYSDKLRVYALPVVLLIRFRFFLNKCHFLETPKLFVTLSFQKDNICSCQVKELHKLTDLPVLFCFVFLLFSDLIEIFLTIYWLNGIITCINKGCWFLLTSDVPQLHPLFSLHYMFFHNMLSGTQCTQCCCDYV